MYPPLHRQGALRHLEVIPNDFPVATRYSETTLWLPSSFSIYKEEISFISRTIKEGLSWIQQLAA
jgi:dTDP-4-amino-4,6-dideoxygalactose transaminase